MANRIAALVLVRLVALAIGYSLGKRPTPSATIPLTGQPALRMERLEKIALGPGGEVFLWKVRCHQVKEIKAQLLIAKDGAQLPGKEIICQWTETSPEAEGQPVFAMESSDPFDAKNQRLPILDLTFPHSASGTIISTQDKRIDGPLLKIQRSFSASSYTIDAVTVPANKPHVAVGILFTSDDGGGLQSFGSIDGLLQTSKNGRLVIGVIVNWQ